MASLRGLRDAARWLLSLPDQRLVDHPVGLGEREHAKAVVVHAGWQITGRAVLRLDDAADGAADGGGVAAVVGVFAAGKEGHQADAGDGGTLVGALPASILGLVGDEPGEAVLVDGVDFGGDLAAVAEAGVLGVGGGGEEGEQEGEREVPFLAAGRCLVSPLQG